MRLLHLLCLLPVPAFAQELPEVDMVPPGVMAAVLAAADLGEIVDRVRLWQGDLNGDAQPDLVVQAAYANQGGGNAVWLRQWIFAASGAGYDAVRTLDLPDGIKAVRRAGADLVVTTYSFQPGDPRCCPTGQAETRVALD